MEELLKQLLEGQQRLEKRFDSLEQRFGGLDQRLDTLNATVSRIEKNHGDMLTVLCDAREVQQDTNDLILNKLNNLASKLDKQDLILLKHDRDINKLKQIINI